VAGCCECGDEPSGSCATELVSLIDLTDVGPELKKNDESKKFHVSCKICHSHILNPKLVGLQKKLGSRIENFTTGNYNSETDRQLIEYRVTAWNTRMLAV
jgi:hypothetical protein